MVGRTHVVRDPRSLRAIAHPIRLRLYEALVAEGPATAARLGKDLPGVAPGSLSYHLRQLEVYGYIETVRDLADDGRERWWRAIPGGARWSEEELEASPAIRAAADAAQSVILGRQVDRLRRWMEQDSQTFSSEWRAAATSTDTIMHLNVDELRELSREVEQLLDRWTAQSRSNRERARPGVDGRASAEDPSWGATGEHDRHPVFVVFHAFPFALGEPPPTSERERDPRTGVG